MSGQGDGLAGSNLTRNRHSSGVQALINAATNKLNDRTSLVFGHLAKMESYNSKEKQKVKSHRKNPERLNKEKDFDGPKPRKD